MPNMFAHVTQKARGHATEFLARRRGPSQHRTPRSLGNSELYLPTSYQSREAATFFDDFSDAREPITYQPYVYRLAGHLAARFGSSRVVDIGCGSAEKLLALADDFDLVGVDHPSTVAQLTRRHPSFSWFGCDLESTESLPFPLSTFDGATVVCSDVIEHLTDPYPLLSMLRQALRRADTVLVSTPDRVLARGPDDQGPPANPFHVREWQLDELHALLRSEGLPPTFVGLTVNNDRDLAKRTILAVLDKTLGVLELPPTSFRVRALYSCFNERDIVVSTVNHLLKEGVDVTIIDDWSTDGTWELLHDTFGSTPRVELLRHGEQANDTYNWESILRLKEQVGHQSGADWLIHHDADEIRFSPWSGTTMRTALWNIDRRGFNAVDHTVIEFRPLTDGFTATQDPASFFTHFEWGRRSGHFVRVNAWKNTGQAVGLAASAGHTVSFPGVRVAPYKFLLQHFPLRSPQQAKRKVALERWPRFRSNERDRGWHLQYDDTDLDGPLLWNDHELEEWDAERFAREYLVERISGVGIVR